MLSWITCRVHRDAAVGDGVHVARGVRVPLAVLDGVGVPDVVGELEPVPVPVRELKCPIPPTHVVYNHPYPNDVPIYELNLEGWG